MTMEEFATRYRDHALIRALVQLVPFGIGSATDALIVTRLEKLRRERARVLFDELASGRARLSPDLIQSDDFLHSYFVTLKAALDTRRHGKIRLFARLLRAAATSEDIGCVDEYEELLGTLDELSYREIQLLSLLDRYTRTAAQTDGHEQNSLRQALKSEIEKHLGISPEELPGILARLQRSGLFTLAGLEIGDHGHFGISNASALGLGELSRRYHRLLELIGDIPIDQA
jgi:hypothetical protein